MARKLQLISIFLWISGVLAACITPPAPTDTIGGQSVSGVTTIEPISLKVGALPFLSSSILKIAQEEGYFSEQGLNIELLPQQSSNDIIPLLLKGDLDVAATALTAGMFNAVANGGTLKLALPLNSFAAQGCTSVGIMARRQDMAAGGFTTPAQWSAAKVTLPPAGPQSTNGYILDQILQQGNLTLKDITLTPVDLPAQAEALASGQTDLVYAVEPWVTRMSANPELALLMPVEPVANDFTASVIAFGTKPLADPTIGERFAAAYVKAVQQYTLGKTPRNIELVAAYTKLEPAVVEKICWPAVASDGRINIESILGYQSWLNEQNLIDRLLTAEEIVDTHFAEVAEQSVGKAKP